MTDLPSVTTLSFDKDQNQTYSSSNIDYFKTLDEEFQAQRSCVKETLGISSHNPKRNVILTMAEGYDCKVIEIFVHSLRLTGSNAEIYLFRSDANIFRCPHILDRYKNVFVQGIQEFSVVRMEVRRYILALDWMMQHVLKSMDEHTQVIVVDFQDVLFQRDPFLYFSSVGAPLVFADEGYTSENLLNIYKPTAMQTIFSDPSRATWRWTECASAGFFRDKKQSDQFMTEIEKMPILNSGFIMGSAGAMKRFLYVFTVVLNQLDLDHPYLAGQGILDFIYYKGLLQGIGVKVLPIAASFFVHTQWYLPPLKYANQSFDTLTNPFVNLFNVPFAVVHQTNRLHVASIVDPWKDKADINRNPPPPPSPPALRASTSAKEMKEAESKRGSGGSGTVWFFVLAVIAMVACCVRAKK